MFQIITNPKPTEFSRLVWASVEVVVNYRWERYSNGNLSRKLPGKTEAQSQLNRLARCILLFFLIVIYRSPFLRPSFSLVMVSGSEWMSQLGELLNRDWFLPKKEERKRLFKGATSLFGGPPIEIFSLSGVGTERERLIQSFHSTRSTLGSARWRQWHISLR